MKPSRRVVEIILPLLTFLLLCIAMSCSQRSSRQVAEAVSPALVDDLRRHLQMPTDSLKAALDRLLLDLPDELGIFDFLKAAKDAGLTAGGFVETSPKTLMKPEDRDKPEAQMFEQMTLSTAPAQPLPSEKDLQTYDSLLHLDLAEGMPLQGSQYLPAEDGSSLNWYVRPFQTREDTTVKFVGLGFRPQTALSPAVISLLENSFVRSNAWQQAADSSGGSFALEMVNPDSQAVFIIGDKTDKKFLRAFTLDAADLLYNGWKVDVWWKKGR